MLQVRVCYPFTGAKAQIGELAVIEDGFMKLIVTDAERLDNISFWTDEPCIAFEIRR